MIEFSRRGMYCPAADISIDAQGRTDRVVVTHAHSDHARPGHRHYLAHPLTAALLKHRLGPKISVQSVEYGEVVKQNGVRISLHPAGHVPGSAQVRLERRGEVWVVSGDYKLEADGVSDPFEPVRCHVFVTESTFGLPIFRWPESSRVVRQIVEWWRNNRTDGRVSVLLCYPLGKAQRLLRALHGAVKPVAVHTTIQRLNRVISGFRSLPAAETFTDEALPGTLREGLLLAPSSVLGSAPFRSFRDCSVGFASGWMAVQRFRRQRGIENGFVVSDHADWCGLNQAVRETGAGRILVTHGYTGAFARWLSERGYQAREAHVSDGDDGTDSKTGKAHQ